MLAHLLSPTAPPRQSVASPPGWNFGFGSRLGEDEEAGAGEDMVVPSATPVTAGAAAGGAAAGVGVEAGVGDGTADLASPFFVALLALLAGVLAAGGLGVDGLESLAAAAEEES